MAYTWTQLELGLNRNQNWRFVSCSSDGTIIVGQFVGPSLNDSISPILISKDSGSTWTVVPRPPAWHDSLGSTVNWIALTSDGSAILIHNTNTTYRHLIYKTTDDGDNWTSMDFTASQSNLWTVFDMDPDASTIVAAGGTSSNNGRVNISTNSGSTWNSYIVDTSGRNLVASRISVSDSGAKLICYGLAYLSGFGWGRTYTSTDYGASWTIRDPASHGASSNLQSDVAISGDGSVMVANSGHGTPAYQLWKSVNDGVNWTNIHPNSTSSQFSEIGISSDGQTIVIGTEEQYWYTTNGGTDWTRNDPSAVDYYFSWEQSIVQGSTVLVVGGQPLEGNIYISLDSCTSWNEKRIGTTFQESFTSISVTSDGQKIIVCNEADGVYTSTDYGATFTPFIEFNQYSDGSYIGDESNGILVKVSKDGSMFYAASRWWGKSYYSTDDGATWSDVDYSGGGIDDWQNDAYIVSVALSEDGRVIALSGDFYLEYGGGGYWEMAISTDYGATWSGAVKPYASSWTDNWNVALTDDGLVLLVSDQQNKRVYRSIDYGSSFSLVNTLSSMGGNPIGIACDSNGDTIAVCDSADIQGSVNAGSTFSEIYDGTAYAGLSGVGNSYTETVVVGDNGDNIVLMSDTRPYISTNGGASWAVLDATLGLYAVPTYAGDSNNYAIAFAYEEIYLTYVASVPEAFSDAGYYHAAYIHGQKIESGSTPLKNQTTVLADWKLPFAFLYTSAAPDEIVEYRRIRLQHTTPFWDKEESLEDSRPIELHRFSTSTMIWRYADAPYDVDYNGTDGVVTFRGFVINVAFNQTDRIGDRQAEITIEPYSGNTKVQSLTLLYSRLCSVAIYSDSCGVDPDQSGAAWNDSGLLTGVSGTELTATEFGDKADGWYSGGKINVNGVVRKILDHTGTTITISRIIPGAAVNDPFTIYAGCDRLYTTCKTKFDNLLNCKALPLIPEGDDNPYGRNGVVT